MGPTRGTQAPPGCTGDTQRRRLDLDRKPDAGLGLFRRDGLVSFKHPPPPGEEPALITLKSLTVPVIANGTMQGYVLTQITLATKRDLLKTLPQPPEIPMADFISRRSTQGTSRLQAFDKARPKQIVENYSRKCQCQGRRSSRENVFIQELHYLNKQEAGITIGTPPSSGAAAPHH